jgi:hypothetical protein
MKELENNLRVLQFHYSTSYATYYPACLSIDNGLCQTENLYLNDDIKIGKYRG